MSQKDRKELTIPISIRLTEDQQLRLNDIAKKKKMTKALLCKEYIIKGIENERGNLDHIELLQKNVTKLQEEVRKLSTKEDWFEQLYFQWLILWFTQQKLPDDERVSRQKKAEALKMRNDFVQKFDAKVYDEERSLFERLLADAAEHNGEES